MTDAEGEQSVLALALRRLKSAAGKGKRAMAICTARELGDKSGTAGSSPGSNLGDSSRTGKEKEQARRSKRLRRALARACPLGLAYLNLREFGFCGKLEDARVD